MNFSQRLTEAIDQLHQTAVVYYRYSANKHQNWLRLERAKEIIGCDFEPLPDTQQVDPPSGVLVSGDYQYLWVKLAEPRVEGPRNAVKRGNDLYAQDGEVLVFVEAYPDIE